MAYDGHSFLQLRRGDSFNFSLIGRNKRIFMFSDKPLTSSTSSCDIYVNDKFFNTSFEYYSISINAETGFLNVSQNMKLDYWVIPNDMCQYALDYQGGYKLIFDSQPKLDYYDVCTFFPSGKKDSAISITFGFKNDDANSSAYIYDDNLNPLKVIQKGLSKYQLSNGSQIFGRFTSYNKDNFYIERTFKDGNEDKSLSIFCFYEHVPMCSFNYSTQELECHRSKYTGSDEHQCIYPSGFPSWAIGIIAALVACAIVIPLICCCGCCACCVATAVGATSMANSNSNYQQISDKTFQPEYPNAYPVYDQGYQAPPPVYNPQQGYA